MDASGLAEGLERCPANEGLSLFEVREDAAHLGPEAWAVVHGPQVRKLVGHHVVDDAQAKLNQPPIEPNVAIYGATAPTCLGM